MSKVSSCRNFERFCERIRTVAVPSSPMRLTERVSQSGSQSVSRKFAQIIFFFLIRRNPLDAFRAVLKA